MRQLLKFFAVFSWLAAGGLSLAARRTAAPPGTSASTDTAAHDTQAAAWNWKRDLLKLAALFAVLGIGGFLFAASGIMPIKASSGHWAITEWFLNFSMSRSVDTHSKGLKAPPLDVPLLVQRGAGHYEIGCRPCHGSPELHHPRIARAMTPHPPYLPEVIHEWEPEELFYIVKHGVKFTGMPAWPTQKRDDEVWAMTAFLLEFPKLDFEQYRRLARGESESDSEAAPLEGLEIPGAVAEVITENCARCHGIDGMGRGTGAFPILAGQNFEYLDASLRAYERGERHSGIMQPIAAGLSTEETRAISRYYAGLSPPEEMDAAGASEAAVVRVAAIAQNGVPAERVPACVACHGPTDSPRNAIFPELAGQYADYLVLQLELFKKRHRGGTEYAHLMHHVADGLKAEQMRDVAAYYSSLRPAVTPPREP